MLHHPHGNNPLMRCCGHFCVQVTRSGLTNACGIAGIMLTTQAVMVEKRAKPVGGAGGGGYETNGGLMPNGMPAGLTM